MKGLIFKKAFKICSRALSCGALSALSDSRTCHLVAHAIVTAIAVLSLQVLVCGTVCRCSFESRTFRLTVSKTLLSKFLFQVTGIAALCD